MEQTSQPLDASWNRELSDADLREKIANLQKGYLGRLALSASAKEL